MKVVGISAIVPNSYDNNLFFSNLIENREMTDQRNTHTFEICWFTQVMSRLEQSDFNPK